MDIKFICPSCGHDQLECCMNGSHTCPVIQLDKDGDFDYGPYESTADVDRWQCAACGFVVEDINGGGDIVDNQEVAEWCIENCPQE